MPLQPVTSIDNDKIIIPRLDNEERISNDILQELVDLDPEIQSEIANTPILINFRDSELYSQAIDINTESDFQLTEEQTRKLLKNMKKRVEAIFRSSNQIKEQESTQQDGVIVRIWPSDNIHKTLKKHMPNNVAKFLSAAINKLDINSPEEIQEGEDSGHVSLEIIHLGTSHYISFWPSGTHPFVYQNANDLQITLTTGYFNTKKMDEYLCGLEVTNDKFIFHRKEAPLEIELKKLVIKDMLKEAKNIVDTLQNVIVNLKKGERAFDFYASTFKAEGGKHNCTSLAYTILKAGGFDNRQDDFIKHMATNVGISTLLSFGIVKLLSTPSSLESTNNQFEIIKRLPTPNPPELTNNQYGRLFSSNERRESRAASTAGNFLTQTLTLGVTLFTHYCFKDVGTGQALAYSLIAGGAATAFSVQQGITEGVIVTPTDLFYKVQVEKDAEDQENQVFDPEYMVAIDKEAPVPFEMPNPNGLRPW